MTIWKQRSLGAELRLTGDGSHTLFVPGLKEHYHSVYGAITESLHVFIGAGLRSLPLQVREISILEVGFGTGLNAFLTCLDAQKRGLKIRYISIENDPISFEMTSQFNFADQMTSHSDFSNQMSSQSAKTLFNSLHRLSWDTWHEITPYFHIRKVLSTLENYQPGMDQVDLIYFDAFGPDVQPEMWTSTVFEKISLALKRGGILVTYSTKGIVKRNLKSAGFSIEKLPGPPGKREILRASFNPEF